MNADEIGNKLKNLPDHVIPEALDYIEFLITKYGSKKVDESNNENTFKFDWEGGLSKLSNQYTAVELQHRALDWR